MKMDSMSKDLGVGLKLIISVPWRQGMQRRYPEPRRGHDRFARATAGRDRSAGRCSDCRNCVRPDDRGIPIRPLQEMAPNNSPAPAVNTIASRPQKVTRAAPRTGDAPAAFAASAPIPASPSNETAKIAGITRLLAAR